MPHVAQVLVVFAGEATAATVTAAAVAAGLEMQATVTTLMKIAWMKTGKGGSDVESILYPPLLLHQQQQLLLPEVAECSNMTPASSSSSSSSSSSGSDRSVCCRKQLWETAVQLQRQQPRRQRCSTPTGS
jgi:hypothetical protein